MTLSQPSPEDHVRQVLEEAKQAFASIQEKFDGYRTDVELLAFVLFRLGVEPVRGLGTGDRSYDAVLLAKARLIAVEAEHHVHRRRFSIAHEIGHYVLHYRPDRPDTDEFRCSTRDMGVARAPVATGDRRVHLRQEWEANRFAGELLMPEDPFRAMHQAVRGDTVRVAKHFDVSTRAVEVRLAILGLPVKTTTRFF